MILGQKHFFRLLKVALARNIMFETYFVFLLKTDVADTFLKRKSTLIANYIELSFFYNICVFMGEAN